MSKIPKDVVITSALRTPIGKYKGSLKNISADKLGALVIKEAIFKSSLKGEDVDEVIMGHVLTAGLGQNPARQASIHAGVPVSKPAHIVNQVCGSGLRSIISAYQSIKLEQNEIVVAGGQENMSRATHAIFLRDDKKFIFEHDEYLRNNITLDDLEKLNTVFKENGTVTPGNSSGLNDGAAALVLMTREKAELKSLEILASIVSWSSSGVEPSLMGLGPIPSIKEALIKAQWQMEDIDLFEINEAFAAQTLAVIRELKIPEEKVNVNGGAIALGHPIGASGSRIVATLIHELKRQGKKKGCAALCIGGGMGIAMCVERN